MLSIVSLKSRKASLCCSKEMWIKGSKPKYYWAILQLFWIFIYNRHTHENRQWQCVITQQLEEDQAGAQGN